MSPLQYCDDMPAPVAELGRVPCIDATSGIRLTFLDHLVMNRDVLAWRIAQEQGLHVGHCFADVEALLAIEPDALGDVIVSNYALAAGSLDGIVLVRLLRQQRPRQRLLILSDEATTGLVSMVMRAGASGVVSKSRPWAEIVAAIRTVAAGHASIARDPTHSWQTAGSRRAGSNMELTVLDHPWLTEQERDVLRCCLTGLSVNQIAQKLQRSAHTISTQKRCAFRKLDIGTDFDLFAMFG